MVICPFLTTADECVECFSECAFNTRTQPSNECPFTAIEKEEGLKRSKKKTKVNYDFKQRYTDDYDFYHGLGINNLNII